MKDSIDEFLEIVGTEKKVVYHFYVLSSGMIEEIRKEDYPDDGRSWPLVWSRGIKNRRRRIRIIKEIREKVDSGKADTQNHPITWK